MAKFGGEVVGCGDTWTYEQDDDDSIGGVDVSFNG